MPRGLPVLLLAAVVPLGVLVMLVRVAGPVPAWDSIYAEDLSIFLVQALQHPWPLLVPYAGYLQLVPRLIAQFVFYLPLRDAAAAFAIIGALITGFLAAAFGATLKPGVTTSTVTENFESGSRYTALPIFLIESAAVVAVGSFICHGQHRLRTVAAVTALVGVLSVGWVTDFRYSGWRSGTTNWPSTATAWLHACQRTPDGVIRVPTGASFYDAKTAVPCASLRRLCRAARSRGAGGPDDAYRSPATSRSCDHRGG